MAADHVESACGPEQDAGLRELAHDILWLDDEVLGFIEDRQGTLA